MQPGMQMQQHMQPGMQMQQQQQHMQPGMQMQQQQGPPRGGPPPNSQQVAGLTDRRYEGVLTTYRSDKGFGFIKCAELREKFPDKDVFVHAGQMGGFTVGAAVNFGIYLNKDGKPQAYELVPSSVGGGPTPQMYGGGFNAGAPGAVPVMPAPPPPAP
ncbi:unnamed protein product, partial [Polarella glacialis]